MRAGQAEGVDLSRGSFQEGKAIFKLVSVLQGRGRTGPLLHQRDGTGFRSALRFEKAKQGGWARHESGSNSHGMGQIKQAPLKPSILLQSGMEQLSPLGIGKITINLGYGGAIQWAADRIALYEATALDEVRVRISHSILVGRRPHEWRETKRHIVTKVNGSIVRQQVLQRVWSAEVKRIE